MTLLTLFDLQLQSIQSDRLKYLYDRRRIEEKPLENVEGQTDLFELWNFFLFSSEKVDNKMLKI